MIVIKRFLIGFTVFTLNLITVFLIICGAGALELSSGVGFVVFVIPMIYIALISCFFLIKMKC